MKRLPFLALMALPACGAPPAGSAADVAASAITPAPIAASATQTPTSDSSAVVVPKMDLGTPPPAIVVRDLSFRAPGDSAGHPVTSPPPNDGMIRVPALSPAPGSSPLRPMTNASLPALLGIGHGGDSVFALVNDPAHAILRIGDHIGGTTISAIDESGVALADGRRMTVSWTNSSGPPSGTVVPNIDIQPATIGASPVPIASPLPLATNLPTRPLPQPYPSASPPATLNPGGLILRQPGSSTFLNPASNH